MVSNMTNRQSSHREQKWLRTSGQSVVELALLIPVLIALLVVVSDLARVFYVFIEVSDAARAGAQYGGQNRTSSADFATMQQRATNAASDITGMTAVASNFCTCSDGGAVVSCTNSGCVSTIHLYVSVVTNTTFTTLYLFPGIPSSVALQGSAIVQVK